MLYDELEYQDPDGEVYNKIANRIVGKYNTLQEACEAFGPDNPFLQAPVRLRAWNFVKKG